MARKSKKQDHGRCFVAVDILSVKVEIIALAPETLAYSMPIRERQR